MSKYVWFGNFVSEADFECYLDQKRCLEAWAIYDNEPATGDDNNAEPSTELRCDFCKEVDLDFYDEDFMIIKYYPQEDIAIIASDLSVDKRELEALFKKKNIKKFNSVIAYEGADLTEEQASNSMGVVYIGNLVMKSASALQAHYLWVGDKKLDKKTILKHAGIRKDSLIKLSYNHASSPRNVDEMLILKVDNLNIITVNSILELILKGDVRVDDERIGGALGMTYIGKF
ncbi:uncharacterized protein SPAPADRAFT_67966 [Spathaspora passalidarum NRRL Y-27907]|uniref:Uncharacterized protein n=1 Tax=Spathaspora passalidarum (strain NRRL Y-27907 / 11-Y1) TaxID=619300 RepID=G3ASN2_SPAPN|nr:uncharacterized protein SPAPADRAFT_67966 [Spathaspora passalidarum NRRL Y-27907]EGW30718.1 hypothetical protein SPAPADRAFT_67966 [Spathaspora passalidarum NRRL Y-27907]